MVMGNKWKFLGYFIWYSQPLPTFILFKFYIIFRCPSRVQQHIFKIFPKIQIPSFLKCTYTETTHTYTHQTYKHHPNTHYPDKYTQHKHHIETIHTETIHKYNTDAQISHTLSSTHTPWIPNTSQRHTHRAYSHIHTHKHTAGIQTDHRYPCAIHTESEILHGILFLLVYYTLIYVQFPLYLSSHLHLISCYWSLLAIPLHPK